MNKLKIGVIGSIIEGDFANLITTKGVIIDAIINSCQIPIILPITKNKNTIERLVQKLDGIILQEGQIVSPFLYGENPKIKEQEYLFERDFSELIYLEIAEKYNKKVLGINRGAHIINIYHNGSLYQNLEEEIENPNYHIGTKDHLETYHKIEIIRNSVLYEILGKREIIAKSKHRQGIKKLGNGLRVSAISEDETIEAFEGRNILGIQFTLEKMEDEYTEKIMKYFIESRDKDNE